MRIVTFSDSHGDLAALSSVLKAQPQAAAFLHLGDGHSELEYLRALNPKARIMFVRGNCDWGSTDKDEEMLVAAGKKIFFTHGHMYDVKRGVDRLIHRALSLGADVACFGHTHASLSQKAGDLHLLNPGSVHLPRGGPASYGVIDITPQGGITTKIMPVQTT